MSHFKGFMWVDGWSTTRERTVVKIPINQGQRNMTWAASGPYLPMAEPVDWNCIPSALGCGSVLNVSTGRLHFPLTGSWLMPLSAHPGVHPVLTSWWWIHNFKGEKNSSSEESLCYILMQSQAVAWDILGSLVLKLFQPTYVEILSADVLVSVEIMGIFSFPFCKW